MTAPTTNRLLTLLQEAQAEMELEIRRRTSGPHPPTISHSLSNSTVAASHITPVPSPTSVLAELRTRFQPYSTPTNQRFRIAGRSAGRRSVAAPPRTWSNKFFCLGGPEDIKTPSNSERIFLSEENLGERVITADANGTSQDLIKKIQEEYSKLMNVDFELMRCVGTGGYGKPLVRVSSNNPVPDVNYLKVSRISTIFIRPLTLIAELETDEIEDTEIEEPVTTSVVIPNIESMVEDTIPTTSSSSAIRSPMHQNTMQFSCDDEEVPTMVDLRARLHACNPGLQFVYIARDNFLERLFGIYKYPKVELDKELRVEFIGEAGTDYGALTREFFWIGLLALTRDKLEGRSLFEGASDHLVPSTDSVLLRTGIFQFVGKFIAHSAINSGIGFIGLSEAAIEYLTGKDVDSDTPISITVADLPDHDHQLAILNIKKLQEGAILEDEDAVAVQELALASDFTDRVTVENATAATEQILYHQVIERRKSYLDAIKKGLEMSSLLPFLQKNSYIISSVFPRTKDVKYPKSLVLDRIVYKGDVTVIGYIKEYLTSLSEETMSTLIEAWTGWPVLPEGPLKMTVEKDCTFEVHTCFEEIFVPEIFNETDVKTSFDLLIANPQGFGRI